MGALLAIKAKPMTAEYYDPKLSGMTLESWSCHHPNDLVLSCSDGAGSDADRKHLPPSTPPPPSPVAPPPAPCADNFCRLRKFYAEHIRSSTLSGRRSSTSRTTSGG